MDYELTVRDLQQTMQAFVKERLTKREQFACAALQGLCAGYSFDAVSEVNARQVAKDAFWIADEMIRASKKPADPQAS